MRRCSLPRRVSPLLLLLGLLALTSLDAGAQIRRDFHSGLRTGIGYAAVLPDVAAGVGVWHMLGPRFGVFTDAKITVPSLRSDDLHCPTVLATCTIEWVEANRNDVFIRDRDEYLIFNAGGMYAITREFMFMLGAGVARWRGVREYFDESDEPITETGKYYIDHEVDASWDPQLVGGMLIRAGNRLVFRFGYESAPGGMSLGVYLVP